MLALVLVCLTARPPSAVASTSTWGERFQSPATRFRPKQRWWWPGAAVTRRELARELKEMSEAGFSGAEIASLPPKDPSFDLTKYGWDQALQTEALENALSLAPSANMRLDLTLAASWPLNVPTISSLDDPRAEQELIYNSVSFSQAFDGPIPPAPSTGAKLVAVTVAEVENLDKPVLLKPDTLVDLTSQVKDGRIRFTPQAHPSAKWILFSFWRHPTGQVTERPVMKTAALVLDHFSRAATKALTDDWETRLLSPGARAQLLTSGGDVFADSLEISAFQLWTADFLEVFRKWRGYDLTPYLPILHIENIHSPYASFLGGSRSPDDPPDFEIGNGIGQRIRWDYYQTLNDLMELNHLRPLQEWAHHLGLKLRYQPAYGTTLNMISNARFIDVTETESLHSGNQIDYHRAMATLAHVRGLPVVSNECCAELFGDYGQTLKEALAQMHTGFAGGVTQVVWHGRPYRLSGAAWPGWQPFAPQTPVDFSEAWDSRQPYWPQMREVNDYLARLQMALREGQAKVDLAIYRQSFWWPANRWFFATSAPPFYADSSLGLAGFTYDFVDPSLFPELNMNYVHGGAVLGRPAYRALLLDHQTSMDLNTARQLRDLVAQGLTLILIGEAPSQVPGFHLSDDDSLRTLFRELKKAPGVFQVEKPSQVLGALSQARIEPAARFKNKTGLQLARRASKHRQIYFLLNPDISQSADEEIGFETRSETSYVYGLDAWSGHIRPLAFRRDHHRTTVNLHLEPQQTSLILLSDSPIAQQNLPPDCCFQTTAQELKAWDLEVESFTPEGNARLTFHLDSLKDWREMESLADTSGVGHYRSSFNWNPADGPLKLQLGQVWGKFRVRLNGHALDPVDPFKTELVLNSYLQVGENNLEVEVATTLRNRLRTLWQSGWEEQIRQLYQQIGAPLPADAPYSAQGSGLIGPVWLKGLPDTR